MTEKQWVHRVEEVRKRLHQLRNQIQAQQSYIEMHDLDLSKAHTTQVNAALKKLSLAVELLEE